PKEASGLVKSMMTKPGFKWRSIVSVTSTPRCSAAEISPASYPAWHCRVCRWRRPARLQRSAWRRAPRPRPFVRRRRRQSVPTALKLEQAEIGHRLLHLFKSAFRHRGQRQTQFAGAFAHERKSRFDGNGIGFEENAAN